MIAMLRLELKKHIQDKGLLFWMLLLPIIFTVLFISVFTSNVDEITKQEVIISIVPGYTVMFVFFIIISMVTSFIKDRDSGMIARLASTPLKVTYYLLGKWLPFLVIVFVQMIVLLLFGKIVYQVPFGQPIYMISLSFVLSFMVTGLGLLISLIVKTDNMGIAMTQLIALGGAFIGGLWVPLEMLPQFLRKIAKFSPQYWGHLGLREAMSGTLIGIDFVQLIAVLLLFGLVPFIIAIIYYPKFLQKAKG